MATNTSSGNFKKNHPLSLHTSWRIGGVAQYFYQPKDLEGLSAFLKSFQEDKIVFLGAGTNVLVRSTGIKGLVVCLNHGMKELQQVGEGIIRAESGVSLSKLGKIGVEDGMLDAAFLAGIPGTVGGALAMNAGAHGDCIWNHVVFVETITRQGEIKTRMPRDFAIGYRNVVIPENEWFVAGHFKFFDAGKHKEAKKYMLDLLEKRRATQPVTELSCGSVFRNPPNDHAARLIEEAGLKGYCIGDAKVSEKHANFIINKGHATSQDIEHLMAFIVEKVFEIKGIRLVPEVHVLG